MEFSGAFGALNDGATFVFADHTLLRRGQLALLLSDKNSLLSTGEELSMRCPLLVEGERRR
jgi:hypothetical protein